MTDFNIEYTIKDIPNCYAITISDKKFWGTQFYLEARSEKEAWELVKLWYDESDLKNGIHSEYGEYKTDWNKEQPEYVTIRKVSMRTYSKTYTKVSEILNKFNDVNS